VQNRGAGKTTIAANLGIVSAQAGYRVVVVDANLRHPALHELFNVPNTTGLADLLTGSVQNVNECMVKTEIENLGPHSEAARSCLLLQDSWIQANESDPRQG